MSTLILRALLLSPLLLSCLEVRALPAPPTSTAREEAPPQYQELLRTFDRLGELELEACRNTFRFSGGNWTGCSLSLTTPYAVSPVQQISPAHLRFAERYYETQEPEIDFFVRVEEIGVSFEDMSLGTRLFLTGYYVKRGVSGILSRTSADYSFEILALHARRFLEELGRERAMSARLFALPGARFAHPLAHDQALGGLYVGEENQPLDVDSCLRVYRTELQDGWPDDDHWRSSCVVERANRRAPLPLREAYWSSALAAVGSREVERVDLPEDAEFGLGHPVVAIYHEPGTFSAMVGRGTGQDGCTDFGVSVPPAVAARLLAAAFDRVGAVRSAILLREAEFGALRQGERVVGKLVMRDDRLDVLE